MIETTVQIDAELVDDLRFLGFDFDGNDDENGAEIDVEVHYTIDKADPSVGIMQDQACPNCVIAVDCNGKRVNITDKIDITQFTNECTDQL